MEQTKIIELPGGKIQGFIEEGIEIFKGVPYAEPPIGDYRFNEPDSKKSWSGVLEAFEFGPDAPQAASFFAPKPAPKQSEEKCLSLAIWTPGTDDKKRPVMFWIHGGSYKTGGANRYNGIPLAKRNGVVFISINYRLGPLGFLYMKDKTANVGLLDQICALKWVKDNVSAFGGDPSNVTIFGESAGAGAICSLLGMPKANGLFKRIIPQSGASSPLGFRIPRVAEATKRLTSLLGLESDDIDGLRKVSAEDIMKAQTKMDELLMTGGVAFAFGYSPLIDGKTLPKHPLKVIESGERSEIDILIGTNRDEMRLWNLWYPGVSDEKDLKKRVATLLGTSGNDVKLVDRVIQTYKKGRENLTDTYTAINTDSFFRIPAIRVAEAQMKHNSNTYMYMFTYPSPMEGGKLGSCHALEIPFVHGTLNMPRNALFPPSNNETETISRKMMDAWSSFAKTGNPNHNDIPEWHAYSNNRTTIMFDTKVEVLNDPFGEERAIWDDIIKFMD